jgi:hypothetical protein
MKLLGDWTSKPWAVVRTKSDPELKVSSKNEKLSIANETKIDKGQLKFVPNQDYLETVNNELINSNFSLEEILFLNLKSTTVLEKIDVERIGIHPKFFQIKSKFFFFCFAIDTSELDEVCERKLIETYSKD